MVKLILPLALCLLPLPDVVAAAPINVGYLATLQDPPLPNGPLDTSPAEPGLQGARLGLADNRTTGHFTGQDFQLVERMLPAEGDPATSIRELAETGVRFVIAGLAAPALLAAADAAKASGVTVINTRATDDILRGRDCRANLLHTAVSRQMLADGLAQYLAWKRWNRWLLVVGAGDADEALADAIRSAGKRFGGRIVQEKAWTFRPGNGRTDSGHVALQNEIPPFTDVGEYDVLVVADEADVFGAYLEGRTRLPRPIAGTHGLIVTAWSPVAEQWGATQLQNRFRSQAGRWMEAEDYATWLAMRSIGEAAVRSRSSDPAVIAAYMRGPQFSVAGFKGRGLSFRDWDGQMRQPVFLVGPRLLVSVSPQPGFLHRDSDLDTLGTDRGESQCHL